MRATGVGEDDFKKPFIGICSSHIEIIPGHVHLDKVRIISDVVRAVGGCLIFNTIGVMIASRRIMMAAVIFLPSRELIADSLETSAPTVLMAYLYPNCDKIVPEWAGRHAR